MFFKVLKVVNMSVLVIKSSFYTMSTPVTRKKHTTEQNTLLV